MAVEWLEIVDRSTYRDGETFGEVGSYERIDAVAHYAVDPTHVANAGIVDLDLVERSSDGLVRYDGDVTILRPAAVEDSQRVALVEVPNRGRRTSGSLYNRAGALLNPSVEIEPGDGLLFRNGWTMAWGGWQWDVPRSAARMGLTAPHLIDNGSPTTAEVQLRLQLHQPVQSVDLTDHHVGILGGHKPLPAVDVADPGARLLRRTYLWADAVEVPRSQWRFGRAEVGQAEPVPDDSHVWLAGGFEPGVIYDLIYRTSPVHLTGAGLLAIRDLGAFLRTNSADNPAAGLLDHLIVTGQSQCGRFLRHFLHLGLNRAEDDAKVYDGVLAHIAGGRRGEFNHRGAQPSVQPTPTFGHRFPFADNPQHDHRTGEQAGLLDTQVRVGCMPKIFYTNTSSEYWRGDASLAHSNANNSTDIEPPDDTRHYLFASTQHSPGALPLAAESPMGSTGANSFNVIDYSPLSRAALFNLRDWIVDGTLPPDNAVPRLDDGTGARRGKVLSTLSSIGHLQLPADTALTTIRALDIGPDSATGVGSYPAVPTSDDYPCFVSEIDDDGNETAGIAMPDVSVPVATHTGWNPRHPDTGAPDQILEYLGSTLPFAIDAADRARLADPRPSLAERYSDGADYLTRVEEAAQKLVDRRWLLPEDVATCTDIAAARYDELRRPTPLDHVSQAP